MRNERKKWTKARVRPFQKKLKAIEDSITLINLEIRNKPELLDGEIAEKSKRLAERRKLQNLLRTTKARRADFLETLPFPKRKVA